MHYDDPPPYYTISINGNERSTVRTRLAPFDPSNPTGAATPGPSWLQPDAPMADVAEAEDGPPVAGPSDAAAAGRDVCGECDMDDVGE